MPHRPSNRRRPRQPAVSWSPKATTASPATPTPRRCSSPSTNTSIILQMPGHKLHMVGGTVGGGFGGKVDVIVEPIANPCGQADRQAGVVHLQPRRGNADLLATCSRDHHPQGWRHERRTARGPAGHRLHRCRRLFTAFALRRAEGGGALPRPLYGSQCVDRHLLRLHQPDAVERHARLRRDHRPILRSRCRWTSWRG